MPEAIVVTPVKDSWKTTIKTIEAVMKSGPEIEYLVYNDFSTPENRQHLMNASREFGFRLINLDEITSTPSPNYRLVLEMAQNEALSKKVPLIIVESDVIVKANTLGRLLETLKLKPDSGLVGAITTDVNGNYNFPYNHVKTKSTDTVYTKRSISFCCTLISLPFLQQFDFRDLSDKKDWFDVFLSRKSLKLGFRNYLAKGNEVIHQPHSSRPWKHLKYSNPLLYYFRKYTQKRDRI
jgi:hypothetical protein